MVEQVELTKPWNAVEEAGAAAVFESVEELRKQLDETLLG